jgi:hypothetical protein
MNLISKKFYFNSSFNTYITLTFCIVQKVYVFLLHWLLFCLYNFIDILQIFSIKINCFSFKQDNFSLIYCIARHCTRSELILLCI